MGDPGLDTGISQYFGHEIQSESTLPLLSYLLKSRQLEDETLVDIFHNVKAGVGTDERPIPDEAVIIEKEMINIINNGPQGGRLEGKPKVTIVGAGTSGLCAGYELKKAGFDVTILEASSRVGGRVKTFRDPSFAPGLHGEGGAMRIPGNHTIFRHYLEKFDLKKQLFDFEMLNKFIYISGYDEGTITYNEFNDLLQNPDGKGKRLSLLFPGLKEHERGKTCDDLFTDAVKPVVDDFWKTYGEPYDPKNIDPIRLEKAYASITEKYDKYSLRSYLTELAQWSEDAINLYDLGNAHVVFENGFIESFKDAFLSSNDGGAAAQMQQLQGGMDLVPNAFISPDRGEDSLIDNIKFGARVKRIDIKSREGLNVGLDEVITTSYETVGNLVETIESDYLILAIPYTSQRTIAKGRAFVPKQEMAVRDVRYVEVTKILLQYKTRWWEKIFDAEEKDPDKKGTNGGFVCDLPIRYTMFPVTKGNDQTKNSKRGVIMAAYTFEQDATILGSLSPERQIQIAAENLHASFPEAKSLDLLEVGASQVFPADELSGGSAFCYFGPMQKSNFLPTMQKPDKNWNEKVFFAGEQASYTHGWIQGAFEAGLRCVQQVWNKRIADQKIL